jgi:hypothetical protein
MKKDFIKTLKKWLTTHSPDEEARWHIQNLLGDYFGWNSKEQQEISELLK